MTKCEGRETIMISRGIDPVIFEIDAGYGTNGKYNVSLRLRDGWHSIGQGDVSDRIPDRLTIPADPEALALEGTRLLLVANYAPAYSPTGRQIHIHYVFIQNGKEVYREKIERVDSELLKCDHVYDFALEDS